MTHPRNRARGRKAHGGGMNKMESAYAELLEQRRMAGEILWWEYEPITLRLAKRTGYTPDFLVMLADQTLQVIEVKAWWEDDARVKIKVAADKFWPLRFIAVKPKRKRDGGGWDEEFFGDKEV